MGEEAMKTLRVVCAQNVVPYSPPAMAGNYLSRLLIESEGVGSERLQLVHATLKPGQSPGEGASHPVPYDEAYYILRGCGRMEFEQGAESYDVGPDTAVFIAGGTWHKITNTGDDDLEFLTIWPLSPATEGVNGVYDERLRSWGTSFRLVNHRAR
jgi:mannose-6-phosphate isomerase-like protein (cupin superfamily)